MADGRRLCDIVIPRTRLDELTYDCAGLALRPGDCVEVRLRGRKARAVVVGLPGASGVKGIRPVERLVEAGLLDSALLKLADWLADYYCCHRGEALGAILPRGIGGYRVGERTPAEAPPAGTGFDVGLLPARSGRFEAVLRFLDDARARGGGLLLLTEAELESRRGELRARFGDDLIEYHSRLGPTGMKRAWRDIREGRGRIVAGTRSAVFAPLAAPAGIAVLDAHDPVFKEERHPRYHARDVAVVRARAADCPVLLADPLPAVETWHNVTTGQYRLTEPLPGPPVRYPASFIVDMRRSPDRVMSPRLRRELELLPDGAAAMLYVNRKGVSRRVVCTGCGAALECPDCRLPMTLGSGPARRLHCGWCGHDRPAPETCPDCGGAAFDLRAAGVELIAREAGALRPDRALVKVESGPRAELPAGSLVVGTRTLLALPWPGPVALVAAVNFDYELTLPDYRARERAFATLATLVNRAEECGAKLLVQTIRPEDSLVDHGLARDVAGFMAGELEQRREAGLPPARRLAVIEIGSGSPGALLNHARRVTRALAARSGVEVIGPAAARGRQRLLVRFPRTRSLGRLLDRALLKEGHLDIRVDVDPHDTI